MRRRPRLSLSGTVLLIVVLLVLSDQVHAADFGVAAPAIEFLQRIGGQLALSLDPMLRSLLGRLGVAGLPISPTLLLGGGLALAVDLVRRRARRERAQRSR